MTISSIEVIYISDEEEKLSWTRKAADVFAVIYFQFFLKIKYLHNRDFSDILFIEKGSCITFRFSVGSLEGKGWLIKGYILRYFNTESKSFCIYIRGGQNPILISFNRLPSPQNRFILYISPPAPSTPTPVLQKPSSPPPPSSCTSIFRPRMPQGRPNSPTRAHARRCCRNSSL